MSNDIIKVDRKDTEEMAKAWKNVRTKANAVQKMSQTDGWKIVRETLEEMIEEVGERAIQGFKDYETYQSRTATARAARLLIDIVESSEGRAKQANERLKK